MPDLHEEAQAAQLHLAAAVVLGVGAKGLRLALGPVEGARVVRQMADQVEADRGRFDA